MTERKLRIGLIGSGFMGKTHAFGYSAAARVFELPYELELAAWPTSTMRLPRRPLPRLALLARHRTGARWSPTPTSMSSTSPRQTRCTRRWRLPLSPPASTSTAKSPGAARRRRARNGGSGGERKGVKTQVGFNYLCNPMLSLARDMIAAGELGEIRGYRGLHAEDYMADPTDPSPSATTRPAAEHWPTSAAMHWPRRSSCWHRQRGRSPASWAIA